ncbi:capsular exopolysaccharide synthesis family protein [Sporomusaceae bacterium BoRhaA]|uniref:CpsD/CapB family tyrosine-protein kinase n=1 Tax=Pelorhabdus rhamnosifermentans TaxID=2772457 RepID=UPI001C0609F0|nr:CpsD/CapB family tyrosine-protein kinase [Pelorhabdus rhamnosifermentans]MBU2699063.1 capsular exopolysaccharide synthesis family protein [Pelorhabdus rhamnosifermentans]
MSQHYQLIVQQDAKSPIAEAYRTLRTNIQFAKIDGELKTLMFTSAGPGEGKSTTAANTAIALAQSGKKVIVVDCDLRKPVQHQIFNRSKRGVTNFLVEDLVVTNLIQDTGIENLRVLTSGPIPPNPSELLGAARMQELLEALQAQSDYLIIDVPPVVAVTDACVLASKVDGILLVLDSSAVHPPEMAQRAKELLTNANGHLLGVILNRVEIEEEHAYYYYYYGNEKKKKA